QVTVKGVSAIFIRQRGQPVAVEKIDVLKISAIGQGILSEDNVMFAFAGLVQERGYPSARVGAAEIDHAGSERPEDGVAVIEKFLRRPLARLLHGAPGLVDGRPKLNAIRVTQLFAQRLGQSLNLVPAARVQRLKEALNLVGHLDL